MPHTERPIAPSAEAMTNAMLAPLPDRQAVPRAGWWLAGVVLLCLIPRLGVALRQSVICRDGVYYIQLAEALESHDWSRAFQTLGLNVYPTLLAALHQTGVDIPTAGKLWGVVVASLTVLPLFGWVRRLFDDRVAWTVALLYAAHPKLMEWSPELVRDPTFWLLWSTSIYCLVRAVREIRLGLFLLAGAAIALAIHTRFEGWLLYVPWVAWTWHRSRYLVAERFRLVRGAMVGVAVYPALLLLVNVTWLHDCPDWQLGSFERLQYVRWWWQGESPHAAQWLPVTSDAKFAWMSATGGSSASAGSTPKTRSTLVLADKPPVARQQLVLSRVSSERLVLIGQSEAHASWQFTLSYLDALRRGFDLGYGLLAAWGIWRWRTLWRRADYLALLAVAIAIFAAIWIHFWYAGATSSRYVLTVLLLALPWTALGLLDLIALLTARVQMTWPASRLNCRGISAIAFAAFFAVGSARALSSRDLGVIREAALGDWFGSTLGAETPVALARTMPLCAYYAGPAQHVTWLDTRDAAWPRTLDDRALTVAIVESNAVQATSLAALAADWTKLDAGDLPEQCRRGKFVVFVRRAALSDGIASPSDLRSNLDDHAATRFRKVTVGR